MNTHNGLIGFFDILGYQNLLEKNEPEDIAQSVLPFLTNINATVSSGLKDYVNKSPVMGESKDFFNKIVDSFEWLIFSDTILLTLNIDNESKKYSEYYWIAFMNACVTLQANMFRAGLPVRGVINYGKYYFKDTCFAGRTIIEAYQLSSQLEIAACVFADNAQKELVNQQKSLEKKEQSIFGVWVHNYLIPTKNGESHFPVLAAHVYNHKDDNIRKQVLSSFWGHNKDIPLSVQKKISNTEQWLSFLKMKEKQSVSNKPIL